MALQPEENKVDEVSSNKVDEVIDKAVVNVGVTGSSETTETTSMTESQIQMKSKKSQQYMIVGVTVFAVFCDILGTAMVIPALASLTSYAEGGPVQQIEDAIRAATIGMNASDIDAMITQQTNELISPYAFQGEKGAWNGSPPFGFSMSMNVIMSCGMVGSAFGSVFFGWLADNYGCKLPMQICVSMGLVGYIIIYASGRVFDSYYLFALGMCWNNFFGNTAGVANVYFGKLFEGAERDAYVGMVMGMAMIGGTIGALIVMPFVVEPKNGENFFNAIWLAMGMTLLSFILVTIVLVPEPKDSEEQSDDEMKEEVETSVLAKKMLVIVCIASALDSAGDEGTRMARGTILAALFPEWSTVERQNYLLIAMIFIMFGTLAFLTALRKFLTLPQIAVFGCTCTLATQLILMLELDVAAFLVIWHVGKLFGFLSTFSSGFMIQSLPPKALLGYWNGRNDMATNVAQAVAPLIFAALYDGFGNVRGQEMLACTAAISFLAICAYLPLVHLMPKEEPTAEIEMKELDHYEEMSDLEYSHLPIELQEKLGEEMMKNQKSPRLLTWGDFETERESLVDCHERGVRDFQYISNTMLRTLADRDKIRSEQIKWQEQSDALDAMGVDKAKAKQEMGAWIADYFDDAGYLNWDTQSQMYKAMLMSAFPPLDALDKKKPDYSNMPIKELETIMCKFLSVVDTHLAAEQRHLKPDFSVSTITNMVKRR